MNPSLSVNAYFYIICRCIAFPMRGYAIGGVGFSWLIFYRLRVQR